MVAKDKNIRLKTISDLLELGLLPELEVIEDGDSSQDYSNSGLRLDNLKDALNKVEANYSVLITAHIYNILKNIDNPSSHPVGRQFIPKAEELKIMPDEDFDPIGDNIHSPVNGIIHRYPDRVLFKVTNLCAVHCRYCFRKEIIGAGAKHLSDNDFAAAINYIKAHKEIWEVILSGGDPLILSARRLQKIVDELNKIDHVRIVRIHSRIPVIDPVKIDDTITSVLKTINKAVHMVIHVNHVDEITKESETALAQINQANCSLFSQSVLLRGVNDNVRALETLFRALLCLHVKPYYLHHLDHARGTSHFRVSLEKGREIMMHLQGRVSGLCLPKYMLDIPLGHGKVPINNDYVSPQGNDIYEIKDYEGCLHLYS